MFVLWARPKHQLLIGTCFCTVDHQSTEASQCMQSNCKASACMHVPLVQASHMASLKVRVGVGVRGQVNMLPCRGHGLESSIC